MLCGYGEYKLYMDKKKWWRAFYLLITAEKVPSGIQVRANSVKTTNSGSDSIYVQWSFVLEIKSKGKFSITVYYGLLHERAKVCTELNVEDISFIQSTSDKILPSYQICNMLRARNHNRVSCSKIHYRSCEFTRKPFMRNINPRLAVIESYSRMLKEWIMRRPRTAVCHSATHENK